MSTNDLTPLLREAADALWLIPQHAGLAQRLTHAAEMGDCRGVGESHCHIAECRATGVCQRPESTPNAAERTRPSEAEVTEALRPFANFWRQWLRMPMRSMDDVIYAIHTGSQYEAEIRRSDCERASEVLEALSTPPLPSAEPVAECPTCHEPFVLNQYHECAMTKLTPPAAAQDTARLDWLQSEENRAGRIASLVVKVNHDRNASEWANIHGDVRAAIDNAMSAARAAGGE